MLTDREYAHKIHESMFGILGDGDVDDINDTTRSHFQKWKEDQTLHEGETIELFKINGHDGVVNPSEASLTNQYGNIYNFGFTFACVCNQETRDLLIQAIQAFHHAKGMKEAGEKYKEIECLKDSCPCFTAFWA